MATFTIETPRGKRVTIEATDEATALSGVERWDLEDHAATEAQAHGLDPDLVLRQMHVESGGNAKAVSPKGARGPMQLMPGTAAELGVDPDDPYQNISGGVRYLAQQKEKYGRDDLALAAYNAGPGAVDKYGGVPPYAETQDYVKKLAPGAGGGDPLMTPEARAHLLSLQETARASGDAAQEQQLGRLIAGMPTAGPAPTAPMKDQGLGFAKGVFTPFDNAAIWAEGGLERLGVPMKAINDTLGMPTARGAKQSRVDFLAQKKAEGVEPGAIGRTAGEFAGTLPLAMLPGGVLAQGALSGAAVTENTDDPMGIARDALYGAAGGKLADLGLGAVGKTLSGVTDKAVQALAKEGVPLTIGQMAGGAVRRIEDAATSLPLVGDLINAAQRRSLEGFNRAAVNRVLANVGEKLPAAFKEGRDALTYATAKLQEKYNTLLPGLKVVGDREFAEGLGSLRDLASELEEKHFKEFDRLLTGKVLAHFQAGQGRITGETMKRLESELGKRVRELRRGDPDYGTRDLADAVEQMQDELRELVVRNNPDKAAELRAINRGWASLKPVERATGSLAADQGVFTPAQLQSATKKFAGDKRFAQGAGLNQDLSDAGYSVLPRKVPDSGTATRGMVGLGLAGAVGHQVVPEVSIPLALALGLPTALYSKPGQKVLVPLLTERPAAAKELAKALPRLKAPAVAAGATAAVQSRQ
jgi:hypothetical protein